MRDLSRRLDRINRQREVTARRQQVMVERPPFDYAGFSIAFAECWSQQLAGLSPEQADARLREAEAAIRAAVPRAR